VEDFYWRRLARPRPKIRAAKSSPGSRRATTPQPAIWARPTPSARDSTRPVGVSRYDYQGTLFGSGADVSTTFDGDASYGAALIGYQFRAQALILKLFAGVEAEDQNITPRDPGKLGARECRRPQARSGSWLDLSPLWFLSVDASYGTAFQQYWSLARVGRRVGPRFSLGLEGGALGNEEYDAGRGGAFLKSNLRGLELTLSGGFTGNYLEDEPSGYVSLGVYRAF
jgi:Cellulose biosynthesis protein BcsS